MTLPNMGLSSRFMRICKRDQCLQDWPMPNPLLCDMYHNNLDPPSNYNVERTFAKSQHQSANLDTLNTAEDDIQLIISNVSLLRP